MRDKGRMPFSNSSGRGIPGGRGPSPHGRWKGATSTTEAQLPTNNNASPTGAGECQDLH